MNEVANSVNENRSQFYSWLRYVKQFKFGVMITISEGKKMLEEMIIRNLNEEAKKLKVRKGSVKFVYLTSVFLDPMNFEAIQFLCNEICLEDNFNKVLAELTDDMAINPKLSCWPNGHLVDINLIFMSKNLVEC